MPWPSRRVPDEVVASARRRLRAIAPPIVRPEVVVPDPDDSWLDPQPPEVHDGRLDTPGKGRRADGEDGAGRATSAMQMGVAGLIERVPATVRDGRVTVSRTAAAGIALLAVAALVLAGSYAWRARAVEAVVPMAPSTSVPLPGASLGASPDGPQEPGGGASASPAGEIVVDVAGKVRRPGVVQLPLGSRVVDAIEAAGGVRGVVDLTGLNLARILSDGEQVLVGVDGAAPAPGAPGVTGDAPDGAMVDLNTATLEQLEALPGVGPVLGQRIIDWRTAHGRFSSIDELREVSGIGDARFADLAPRVRV